MGYACEIETSLAIHLFPHLCWLERMVEGAQTMADWVCRWWKTTSVTRGPLLESQLRQQSGRAAGLGATVTPALRAAFGVYA